MVDSNTTTPKSNSDVIGFLPKPSFPLGKIAYCIHITLFLFVLLPTIALANLCQCLTLLIYPVSKSLFRSWNYHIAGAWWFLLVNHVRFVHRTKFVFTGDKLPWQSCGLLISNHQTMPDIPVLLEIAHRSGLVGGLRFFVKYSLKYAPFLGWGMQFLDFIFVKRQWDRDKEFIYRMFSNLRTYAHPFWVVNFSEGTRSTPQKIKRSQDYAEKRGTTPPQFTMLPRPKGFVETMIHLRDRFDGVYDVTIGYAGARPTIFDFMGGRIREVHCHIKRYPIADLPTSEADLESWLHQIFAAKDQRMAKFARTTSFSDAP